MVLMTQHEMPCVSCLWDDVLVPFLVVFLDVVHPTYTPPAALGLSPAHGAHVTG